MREAEVAPVTAPAFLAGLGRQKKCVSSLAKNKLLPRFRVWPHVFISLSFDLSTSEPHRHLFQDLFLLSTDHIFDPFLIIHFLEHTVTKTA